MTEKEQWEWTRLRERLHAVEVEVKELSRQAKETRAIMQALEDRVQVDGAALVAKMAADGELYFLNATGLKKKEGPNVPNVQRRR